MKKINSSVEFFLELARAQSVFARRFDARLGGLGMSDFLILYHLIQADGEKLRRIDLADKVGLTASGITRLLAPMEKVGLVKREVNTTDARVSFVTIASGGKRKFEEALEDAEVLAEEIVPVNKRKDISKYSQLLRDISR